MMWYEDGNNERDVVLSTRARLARNIEDYPFDLTGQPKVCKELVDRIKDALTDELQTIDMQTLSWMQRLALCEEHAISPEFMEQDGGMLLFDREKGIFLMTPEEDHIRLQVMNGAFAPREVLERAWSFISCLNEKIKFSYDKQWGYLTHCPTNLGNALRLSVMAFLPGIVMKKRVTALSESLSKLGFHVRGMYGEGSKSNAYLFQISNRYSLGMTKDEILSSFVATIESVMELERKCRNGLDIEAFSDTAGRAYGMLRYCRKITYDEFLTHYANLRLAISTRMPLPFALDLITLDQLFVGCAPGVLTTRYSCIGSSDRDLARAKYIQSVLKE